MSDSSRCAPVQLLIGPGANGVVEYARDLATAVDDRREPPTRVTAQNLTEALRIAAGAERVHVHIADRVFGGSAEDSADAVERLSATTRLSVTLHDLPQNSDGPINLPRRAAAYRRIAEAARACAVGSAHEATLFAQHLGVDLSAPVVIPLGVRNRRSTAWPSGIRRTADVAVAGFFYPGKGHDEVIAAMAALGTDPRGATAPILTGLGAISAGHEHEYRSLSLAARASGVHFTMTGYLERSLYVARLRSAGTPVAAHAHISASRSILDWIEAGRRPLVPDTAYTRELLELRPGVATIYAPDALADALVDARSVPEATVLAPGTELGFSLADAAAAYDSWWQTDVPW